MECPLCHHGSVPEPRHRNTISVDPNLDRDLEVEVKIHAFGGSVSAYLTKEKAQELISALRQAFII